MKKLIISILLSIILVVSPFFCSFSIKADYDFGDTFDGKELASQIDNFDGNYVHQNIFKAWSVYKQLGMSDEQASVALACIMCECGFKSEEVEGIESQEQTKVRGHEISGYGVKNTEDIYKEYVENFSMKIDTNFADRTLWTDELLKNSYKIENADANIKKAKENDDVQVSAKMNNGSGISISVSTYYVKGLGYLGAGIYQFTGESCIKLFDWSKANGHRWFEMDNQLAYVLADSDIGGYGRNIMSFVSSTKDNTDIDQLVYAFCSGKLKQGDPANSVCTSQINGNMPSSQIESRQKVAKAFFTCFKGLPWDESYARNILSMAGILGPEDRAGIHDKSILFSYGSVVMDYPLNDGFIIDAPFNERMKEANEDLFRGYVTALQGDDKVQDYTSKKYSLFELYGEDLHWYRYMGETTYTPILLDHIWSAVDQGKADELISFDTIFYDAYNYLSCQVYPNRPHVLSSEEVSNGNSDPRVTTLANGWFNGYDYVLGSLKLTISKYFVSLISFLQGPELLDFIFDAIENFETLDSWEIFQALFLFFFVFAFIAFIISIIKKAKNYLVGTSGSARDIWSRFLIGFISMVLIVGLIAVPDMFNPALRKMVGFIDEIFNYALANSLENDEVICISEDNTVMATHAVLWKNAIFNSWCKGQFDERGYKELYTQFDGNSLNDVDEVTGPVTLKEALKAGYNGLKMPQSHDDTSEESLMNVDDPNAIIYDSATAVGDVFVPVSSNANDNIRNWAAYLMSCGSKYHIDSTLDNNEAGNISIYAEDKSTLNELVFPHYSLKTTANDLNLNADTFRVLDAQMNISPQYFPDGTVTENYKDGNLLKTHFSAYGNMMLFSSAMLLFLVPMIFKKLKSFIMIMITLVKLIYFSIMELFKEDSGFSEFGRDLGKSFMDYIEASLKLNILVVLYYVLMEDITFVHIVLYIVLSLTVLGFTVKGAKQSIQRAKYNVKAFKNKAI